MISAKQGSIWNAQPIANKNTSWEKCQQAEIPGTTLQEQGYGAAGGMIMKKAKCLGMPDEAKKLLCTNRLTLWILLKPIFDAVEPPPAPAGSRIDQQQSFVDGVVTFFNDICTRLYPSFNKRVLERIGIGPKATVSHILTGSLYPYDQCGQTLINGDYIPPTKR